MPRDQIQRGTFPAPVLQELAGQFNRVPWYAVDAGHRRLIHFRQHVMKSMAKLVKQRQHILMGQQRGLVIDGWRKIARE